MDAPNRLGVGSVECGTIFCLLRGLSASAEDFWASSCFLVSNLAAFCLAFLAALLVCLVTSPVTHLSTLMADMERSGWAGTSSVMSSAWQLLDLVSGLMAASAEHLILVSSGRDLFNSPWVSLAVMLGTLGSCMLSVGGVQVWGEAQCSSSSHMGSSASNSGAS